MGKRIIQQARGKGSHTYRVRRKAFSIKPGYPKDLNGEYKIVKMINSSGHTTPIVKLQGDKEVFFNFAAEGVYVGKKMNFGGHETGDVARLGDLKNGTRVFNIENVPGDGGRFIKSGGGYGIILSKNQDKVVIMMPSKKEKVFNGVCRATIGNAAGAGRVDKPILKAGKQFHIKKAKSKLWPRTSAVKMNAIDHPFGSGRGKRIKSKIIKRMSSPGQKVGLLRPRKTGRKKK